MRIVNSARMSANRKSPVQSFKFPVTRLLWDGRSLLVSRQKRNSPDVKVWSASRDTIVVRIRQTTMTDKLNRVGRYVVDPMAHLVFDSAGIFADLVGTNDRAIGEIQIGGLRWFFDSEGKGDWNLVFHPVGRWGLLLSPISGRNATGGPPSV